MGLARPARPRSALLLAVALVSAAGLAYEIALTRIFSLVFQYHYAFLAVSLAILGLGLGAALAAPRSNDSGRPRKGGQARRTVPATPSTHAPRLAGRWDTTDTVTPTPFAGAYVLAALAVAYPLSALLLARLPLDVPLWLRAGSALPPFVLTGLFSALAFARVPGRSGLLYAADLAGAALGVVGALGLLSLCGAFYGVLSLGLAAALAGLSLARGRALWAPALPLALVAALLALGPGGRWLDLTAPGPRAAPRDKTMARLLADPAQGARIVYTAWDPFARVDVVETDDPAAKFVFTDGGAGSYMLPFDGDLATHAALRDTVEFLPFAAGATARTLVLGAGAGKDVLLALLGGAREITALEINPAMVSATRRFAAYNGSILDRPEVRLRVGDARTFVERDRGAYDLIYLNLVYTQAAEPAGQALAESYIFTRQAFSAYLARLAPGGRVAVVSHNALEGSRAALTGLAALAEEGEPPEQALRHLALLMRPDPDPTERQTVLLLAREPLAADAVAALAGDADRLGLTPLFLPGIYEVPLAPLAQGMDLDEFATADPAYDLRPTGDEQPFFFKLDRGLPTPVAQALAGAGLLLALLLSLAWPRARRGGWAAGLGCVALIGAGYMLLEVSLIQRLHLLLGQPALATAAVLGGLLLGGGLGSLLSQRWPEQALARRATVALACIAALGLASWLLLPRLVALLLPAPLIARAASAALLATLLGVPLGVPFPSALRLAACAGGGRAAPGLWSVNGAASVLGSALAVAIAMGWGFGWATALASALYLLAIPTLRALAQP